jgi:hypothetical protein
MADSTIMEKQIFNRHILVPMSENHQKIMSYNVVKKMT